MSEHSSSLFNHSNENDIWSNADNFSSFELDELMETLTKKSEPEPDEITNLRLLNLSNLPLGMKAEYWNTFLSFYVYLGNVPVLIRRIRCATLNPLKWKHQDPSRGTISSSKHYLQAPFMAWHPAPSFTSKHTSKTSIIDYYASVRNTSWEQPKSETTQGYCKPLILESNEI